jgi:peptide/nickel transport system permease protein
VRHRRTSSPVVPAVRFLLGRLVLAIVALVAVSAVVFFLADMLPGDILVSRLGSQALPEQYAALAAQLGVDRPAVERYAAWLVSVPSGDWGMSWMRDDAVLPLVLSRAANSLMLGTVVVLLLVPLSFGTGLAAGLRPGGVIDRVSAVTGSALLVIPEFVTGVILLLVFSVHLRWAPVSATPDEGGLLANLPILILPALPVVLSWFGYFARLVRSSTIDAVASDYVRAAVTRGTSPFTVAARHVVRNAIPPNLSLALLHAGGILGGLLIVEQLFSFPGLGKLVLDATVDHDTPVLLAGVTLTAAITLGCIVLADALLYWLDPRTRVVRG